MKRSSLSSFISMFFIACILAAIYVALTEEWTLYSVLVGFVISAVALFTTQKTFLGGSLISSFSLGGYYLIYLVYLFFIISKGGVAALKYLFTKNIGVNLICYKTQLTDENLKMMLANSITLTPGTVSADVNGDIIEVLKLCKKDKSDQTAGFARIEKMLKHLDKGKV